MNLDDAIMLSDDTTEKSILAHISGEAMRIHAFPPPIPVPPEKIGMFSKMPEVYDVNSVEPAGQAQSAPSLLASPAQQNNPPLVTSRIGGSSSPFQEYKPEQLKGGLRPLDLLLEPEDDLERVFSSSMSSPMPVVIEKELSNLASQTEVRVFLTEKITVPLAAMTTNETETFLALRIVEDEGALGEVNLAFDTDTEKGIQAAIILPDTEHAGLCCEAYSYTMHTPADDEDATILAMREGLL